MSNVSISVRIPTRFKAKLSESGSLGSSAKASLIEAVEALIKVPAGVQSPVKPIPEEPSVAVIIGVRKEQEEDLQEVANRANLGEMPLSQKCRIILTAWLDGQVASAMQSGDGNGELTGLDPVDILGGNTLRKGNDISADDALLEDVLKQMGLKPRHEQRLLFRQTSKHLRREDGKSVLFAEAGTGIGKTLTYLIQAGSFIQEQRIAGTPARVCICAPSYAHITQIMSTWDKNLFAIYGFRPIALGSRKDFVSAQRLSQLMDELETPNESLTTEEVAKRLEIITAVKVWMKNPVAPADFRSRAHWTLEGLRAAAPQFHYIDDVTLDSRHDDEDLGWISYRNQFVHAESSDLWVMTHALLASKTKQRLVHIRRQALADEDITAEKNAIVARHRQDRKELQEKNDAKVNGDIEPQRESLATRLNQLYESANDEANGDQGDLPTFDLLIVDEAHALDAAFDLVLSSRISIWSIINDVQMICLQTPSMTATLNKLKGIFDKLRKAPSTTGSMGHSSPFHSEAENMQSILDCLKSIREPKSKTTAEKCAQEYRRLTVATRALDIALRHRDDPRGMVGSIDWSPDRSWPRLVIGRSSLESEMDYLWRHVARTTILLSGTLYESRMVSSISAMRINLNVALDLVRTMDPIHARWTIEPVTVCKVVSASRPDGSKKFIRPAANLKNKKELHEAWSADIAQYIWSAHHPLFKDQGGMLVLCTSFEDIEVIGKRIDALMGKLNNRQPILMHKKDIRLSDLKDKFFEETKKGARPILIACGSGWTGFDLSDEALPHAVTDLVMVNAPFGVLPDMISKRRRGFLTTVADVDILTRQGAGRLIRHMLPPGSTRRLHWLDARIHQNESASWGKGVQQMLAKYPRHISVAN